MRIRFLETYTVKAQGGETYLEGQAYDLPDTSALHFLKKGRAEMCAPVIESISSMPQITTAEAMPSEVGKAVKKTEERELGTRGGDPIKRAKKAQSDYRKKNL